MVNTVQLARTNQTNIKSPEYAVGGFSVKLPELEEAQLTDLELKNILNRQALNTRKLKGRLKRIEVNDNGTEYFLYSQEDGRPYIPEELRYNFFCNTHYLDHGGIRQTTAN